MSILGRLFPNSHVRDALLYLNSLDGVMDGAAYWSQAKARVRAILLRHGAMIRSTVVVEGLTVRHIVLNLITSQMADDLGQGGDHIHRGKLGRRGVAKMVVFERALAELVTGGHISEDEATDTRVALRADIAGAG